MIVNDDGDSFDRVPPVSIGPSGLGGRYQHEPDLYHPRFEWLLAAMVAIGVVLVVAMVLTY